MPSKTPLTGGRWVTIEGEHVYIKKGAIVAGHVPSESDKFPSDKSVRGKSKSGDNHEQSQKAYDDRTGKTNKQLPEPKKFEGETKFSVSKNSIDNVSNKLGLSHEQLLNSTVPGQKTAALGLTDKKRIAIAGEYSTRYVGKDNDGNLYVENDNFSLPKDERGGGKGTQLFYSQAKNASEAGVSYFKTYAAKGGSQNFNGYYTWARLGYDALIPFAVKTKLSGSLEGAEKISQLMSTQEGRDFWKKNGESTNMTFDLSPDSYSMRTLRAYVAERDNRSSNA